MSSRDTGIAYESGEGEGDSTDPASALVHGERKNYSIAIESGAADITWPSLPIARH